MFVSNWPETWSLGGQRNDTVITDEWKAGGAATSSRQLLLPAFPLNHGLFPRRLYMWCPVISTLLLCVVSIFKSSDLEPQRTLEGTEFRLAGEEPLHSIWDLALHSGGVEVNIPRPPRGFEKGKS